MKIEIISTATAGQLGYHISEDVWAKSRPQEDVSRLDRNMIRSLDLPVNEFARVNLFVESAILIREIITTMRNHVMWAQTSRVQNILDFKCDSVASEYAEHYEGVRSEMIRLSEHDRQDDYRLKLPVMSLVKYSLSMSARDLIKLSNFIYQLAFDEDYFHLRPMFERAHLGLLEAIGFLGFDISTARKYKPVKILSKIENPSSGKIGDTMVLTCEVPFTLRTQLVRHRDIHIKDGLLELMKSEDVFKADLETPITIQASGHVDDMMAVAKKRSCWIAQYNIWKPFLDKIAMFSEHSEQSLPCSDGSCPYQEDAELRYTDKDPNPPCPRHAKLNGKDLELKSFFEMKSMVASDARPEFWNEWIDKL